PGSDLFYFSDFCDAGRNLGRDGYADREDYGALEGMARRTLARKALGLRDDPRDALAAGPRRGHRIRNPAPGSTGTCPTAQRADFIPQGPAAGPRDACAVDDEIGRAHV